MNIVLCLSHGIRTIQTISFSLLSQIRNLLTIPTVPEDVKKTYVAQNAQGMRVPWPKAAEFKDNSGKDPTILSIPASSSYFREGVHQVR